MFYIRHINNTINQLNQGTLRFVYNYFKSNFEEFLEKHGSLWKNYSRMSQVKFEEESLKNVRGYGPFKQILL